MSRQSIKKIFVDIIDDRNKIITDCSTAPVIKSLILNRELMRAGD